MPLLASSVPPGFPPKSVVAPQVFEQMQLYMDCTDPEERRIREFKMQMTLRDLSSNPGAQSSYLRLEDHPQISGVQNKNLGRVFDFRTAIPEGALSSAEKEMRHQAIIGSAERDNLRALQDTGTTMEDNQMVNPFMSKSR
ncbi:unnamed protein product [Brassica rapa subsp. narinosa]